MALVCAFVGDAGLEGVAFAVLEAGWIDGNTDPSFTSTPNNTINPSTKINPNLNTKPTFTRTLSRTNNPITSINTNPPHTFLAVLAVLVLGTLPDRDAGCRLAVAFCACDAEDQGAGV